MLFESGKLLEQVKDYSKSIKDKALETPLLKEALKHPASKRALEFILASGAFAWIGGYITIRNHEQDMATATRNNAIGAVSDISDLTSERRERAALVVSSIRRKASKEEIEARKTAYDEAYVRWNTKVPGDLLRIRASLNLDYGSYFQDYIDGLSDAAKLNHINTAKRDSQEVASVPGLQSIMDACLTRAYDSYRQSEYKDNSGGLGIIQDCQFIPMYTDFVLCFSDVSQALYGAVSGNISKRSQQKFDKVILQSCMPPIASLNWINARPKADPNPQAHPSLPLPQSINENQRQK